jgi:hypothetical protein
VGGVWRGRAHADERVEARHDGVEHATIHSLLQREGAVGRLRLIERLDVRVARRQVDAPRAQRVGESARLDLELALRAQTTKGSSADAAANAAAGQQEHSGEAAPRCRQRRGGSSNSGGGSSSYGAGAGPREREAKRRRAHRGTAKRRLVLDV